MSNYNFRNPTLSFRIERSELQHLDKLAKKNENNLNEHARTDSLQNISKEN